MRRVAAEFARNVVQWVYPNTCLVCNSPESDTVAFRHGLCIACHDAITTDKHEACPWCAQTVGPHTNTSQGCVQCRGVALGFERAYRLGIYDGKLRDAILRTKVLAGEGLADLLGRLFAEHRGGVLPVEEIDLVAPVPLHWWRKLTRGYNQAEAIARELATELQLPFEAKLLRRVKWATQHAQPSRAARQETIKDAFRVSRGARVAGKTLLLVDDVMTTGSTLSEVARTLLNAGAERVVVAVLARR